VLSFAIASRYLHERANGQWSVAASGKRGSAVGVPAENGKEDQRRTGFEEHLRSATINERISAVAHLHRLTRSQLPNDFHQSDLRGHKT
jgi:hypothetical protein